MQMEENMKVISTTYIDNVKKTTEQEITINKNANPAMHVLNIYPDVTYQTWKGFGGALTQASAYVFNQMDEKDKEELIEGYFGCSGNGYNLIRGHIDSCDFSVENYCAISDPDDTEFKKFSLERDEREIIPMMLMAKEKSSEPIELLLSPWSPPAFMKTNNDRNHGGKLKPEFRQMWADYICHYIKEYNNRGLIVKRITIQNEPMAVQTWDSCIYSSEEEKEFLKDYLYPAFIKNGLSDIKINIWDHNKEIMYERAKDIIDDETDKMVGGIAFHWYTGDHFEAVSLVRDTYPDKELIFTEGCVEYSRFDAGELPNAQMYAHDIIGNINHGMNAFIDWNVLLDSKGGPNHVNNYCDAPMMYDVDKKELKKKLSYYYIHHLSHYIKPGAKRVAVTKYTDKLEVTAFKNLDGSVIAVILNRSGNDMPVVIRMDGGSGEFMSPANSIVTVVL